MAGSQSRRVARVCLITAGTLLAAMLVTSCGDDDDAAAPDTSGVATTESAGVADAGGGNGDAVQSAGGNGTATVTVSAGTFDLEIDDACLISEIGLGVNASSSDGSLMIAGPQEIAVVVFDHASGDQWSAAAAEIEVDGSTMSFSGPAMGAGPTISVEVFCDEVMTAGG